MRGIFGTLGAFLLYFEVGTFVLRVMDMDERVDVGAVGNNMPSALGAEFPGIMKTCSSRTFAGPPVALESLQDTLEERASSERSG